MRHIIVLFANAQTACINIAGLPLSARAMLAADCAAKELLQQPNVKLLMCSGSLNDIWCQKEIDRLISGNESKIINLDEIDNDCDNIFIIGEYLLDKRRINAALSSPSALLEQKYIYSSLDDILNYYNSTSQDQLIRDIDWHRKEILKATIKPTDGIVSRKINRPISMVISKFLLQYKKTRPIHATILTFITAVIMFLCFLSGSYTGMIAGAILFQTASMLDGVDGEIARATLRASDFGASLDSMTDAVTNVSFIAGLGISLSLQGNDKAILLASIGVLSLGTGMFLLGRRAVSAGEHINFDGLKETFFNSKIPFSNWLVWITMRDFLALASAVMVILGLSFVFLQMFACGAILWLLVAILKTVKKERSDT